MSRFEFQVDFQELRIKLLGFQKNLARHVAILISRAIAMKSNINIVQIVFVIMHNLIFRSLDDVYLLSAAMQCGPGTLLVSSDMFSNHLQGMDLLMKAQFTRWQELYQMKLASLGGKQPMFEVCSNLIRVHSEPCFNQTVANSDQYLHKTGSLFTKVLVTS